MTPPDIPPPAQPLQGNLAGTMPLPPQPQLMQALKHCLLSRLPALLNVERGARVLVLGAPDPAEVDGQLRLEGLDVLLSALGLAMVLPTAAARGEAGIWLGHAPPAPQELAGLPAGAAVLLWPAEAAEPVDPDSVRAVEPREVAALLPDPMHALWGLLDHHPHADAALALRAGDGGWTAHLPEDRVQLLGQAAQLHRATGLAAPLALARRRLLEAARRVVGAASSLVTDRLGPSLLAALLARHVVLEGEATQSYWRRWCGEAAAWPALPLHPGLAGRA